MGKISKNKVFKAIRVALGIFMISLYLGMAYLMTTDLFYWIPSVFRYILAALLAAYGVYRAYRQVVGQDYYLLRKFEDDNDSY